MESNQQSQEIKIHPTGWESSAESERFPVSALGHLMPKIYVLVSEVFALPENADKTTILKHMVAGLEFSLSQCPILVGALEMDEASGRMWVSKKKASTLSLHVKHMEAPDAFPSYDDMAKKHASLFLPPLLSQAFPASQLVGYKILPESVTAKQLHSPLGDNNEEGLAVATLQINFVHGGLVLAAAVHHCISDGPGFDGFLRMWARNSRAAGSGQPFVPVDPFDLESCPLYKVQPTPHDSGTHVKVFKEHPVVRDAGGPMQPPPPGFQMPAFSQQMWHFPQSKLAQLKAAALPEKSHGTPLEDHWISTYDSIVALLWGGVTRARVDMLHPGPDDTTVLVQAINTRRLWDPALPDSQVYVASAPGRLEKPVSISAACAAPETALQTMATGIRASIRATTADYMDGLLSWVEGYEDRRWLEVNIDSFLGKDLGASSWRGMSAYTAHDFGFGLPHAIRWPCPTMDGFLFLYPTRGPEAGASADEGVEVCVCLEASCQERLMQDAHVLAYAEPRG